jgi:hypothetical protein
MRLRQRFDIFTWLLSKEALAAQQQNHSAEYWAGVTTWTALVLAKGKRSERRSPQ